MIQTVAIGAIAIYLVMVAISGAAQQLFAELTTEKAFVKWILALVSVKFIGSKLSPEIGERLVALVFLALFLSHAKGTSEAMAKIGDYFSGVKSSG